MKSSVALTWFFITIASAISRCSPKKTDDPKKYLFYLPGGIVLAQGIHAVSPDFGPYEYLRILDTLRSNGYEVISEVGPNGTEEAIYVDKVSKQIDSLLTLGVAPEKITVVGASLGAYITIDVAIRLKNSRINYAIMGMCWPDTYKDYATKDLCGNFLSIYESTDPHGSCLGLFEDKSCKPIVQEIMLDMENSHGFIYRPYKEWVRPLVAWMDAAGND